MLTLNNVQSDWRSPSDNPEHQRTTVCEYTQYIVLGYSSMESIVWILLVNTVYKQRLC